MDTGGSFPGGKATEAWSWPLNSSYCWGIENVDLYIHSPVRLHDLVLNLLSTGTTLLFSIYWLDNQWTMNSKGCERKLQESNFRGYSGISLEWLSKVTKQLSPNSKFMGWDLKHGTLKHEAEERRTKYQRDINFIGTCDIVTTVTVLFWRLFAEQEGNYEDNQNCFLRRDSFHELPECQ
jgi:hypothetical protein